MPLTQKQEEEYEAQLESLRRKLQTCVEDVADLNDAASKAQADPSSINMFLAKFSLAVETRKEFSDAWDRIILIHVKLNMADEFPKEQDTLMRKNFIDQYSLAKSFEISLKAEPSSGNKTATCCNATQKESRSGIALLERIKLPHFSGDVRSWARYRDTFSSLVDNDTSLEPVTKLYLLRDSLSGEALSVVNKYDITAANYELAWKSLIDTYENKRVLAAAYLEKIFGYRMKPKPSLNDYQLFLTEVADNISAFRALQLESTEDKILALAMLRTLDNDTRHKFELNHIESDFPTTDSIVKFVRNKCQALKLSDSRSNPTSSPHNSGTSFSSPHFNRALTRSSPKYKQKSFFISEDRKPRKSPPPKLNGPNLKTSTKAEASKSPSRRPLCSFCQQPHILSRCPNFMALSIEERSDFASKWKGCKNCLNPEHATQDCKSRYNCRICQERHHSLLHRIAKPSGPPAANTSQTFCSVANEDQPIAKQVNVILGTARAKIKDADGRDHSVRLLLDSGSHRTFISSRCFHRLKLKLRQSCAVVNGLGGNKVAETLGNVRFILSATYRSSQIKANAAVLSGEITSPLPQQPVPPHIVERFKGLQLADPDFYTPKDIDMLLGADVFDQICTGNFIKIHPEGPSILPTIFGDVIMGSYTSSPQSSIISMFLQSKDLITSQLEAFWNLEEPEPVSRISPADQYCEEHYLRTLSRTPEGRYMVRLPFAADPQALGSNRIVAKKRFASIESKLARNKGFQQDYAAFMQEYERLGHMTIAKSPSTYVIPHFGISQKKLRIVFDASCKSDSSLSLNDILLSGPKLQTDIRDVLMGFRSFPIAITTDLVTMYRQILLHPDDRKHQHIFWRENPDQNISEMELNTVTYGLAPSAFQALRTIQKLIEDEGSAFPLAVQRLTGRIFVDDIVTGADSLEEAKELCAQLTSLFVRGGFSLSKWSSNFPESLPAGCRPCEDPLSPQPENFAEVKVLGLIWSPKDDTFGYVIHELPNQCPSKRIVLSTIARIFDPLGFLAPVVFRAKLFMQDLWRLNLDWDDQIPAELQNRWIKFTEQWNKLQNIRIPRYTCSRNITCRLIGFCDASTRGYAATIYLQVQGSPTNTKTFLVIARTKIAPTKFVSIARLELCGAFLLAKLMASLKLPDLDILQRYAFTDSMVVLGWINTPSHLLSVFEANRVTAIHERLPDVGWSHVRTEDNPADLASRGCKPQHISDSSIWWHGPRWLQYLPEEWPIALNSVPPTQSFIASDSTGTSKTNDDTWMLRFSTLSRLKRVVARILRFVRKSPYRFNGFSESLSSSELNHAILICARSTQQAYFPKGLHTPELASLYPFKDELGVLRVGGRLQNAPVRYDERHPVIVPRSSHLAHLIVRDIHEEFFHAGPSLTLSILRTKFWITSGLRFIKNQLAKCVHCFRRKPSPVKTLMAPLPLSRFISGRPFLITGVDYAGPFTIRDSLRRKPVLKKAYICLFVCFSTRALHLEAVTLLTTEAFLATLDRFIARRGRPNAIYSDNATNVIGASRYMKDVITFLNVNSENITTSMAQKGITWSFIPPRSPHFGGLWEAGVKSVKSLLISTMSVQPFTYEELSTVLARIESVLNSRPICPINEDPNSFEPLTPGHFLIGSPLCALPEENIEDVPMNRLSRWQLVQRSVQDVWSRWRLEYLNTLQQRTKWRQKGQTLLVGDLVVLIEKTSPCGQWSLARVSEVHPGPDGIVRVATVKTPNGHYFKRSVHRLALLPFLSENPEHLTP